MVKQLGGEVVELYSNILDWSCAKLMETLKLGMKGCRGILLRYRAPEPNLRALY